MFKLAVVFALVALAAADVSHLVNSQQGAQILRQESEINPDGSYRWAYETDNGISAQEQGQVRQASAEDVSLAAQGSYQWTSPEGVPIAISYIADENGYQPVGDVLPTPPPIPEAIQRALKWLEANAPREQ